MHETYLTLQVIRILRVFARLPRLMQHRATLCTCLIYIELNVFKSDRHAAIYRRRDSRLRAEGCAPTIEFLRLRCGKVRDEHARRWLLRKVAFMEGYNMIYYF